MPSYLLRRWSRMAAPFPGCVEAVPATRVRRLGSSPNAPATGWLAGWGAVPCRVVSAFCALDFTPAFLEVCVVFAMRGCEQARCRCACSSSFDLEFLDAALRISLPGLQPSVRIVRDPGSHAGMSVLSWHAASEAAVLAGHGRSSGWPGDRIVPIILRSGMWVRAAVGELAMW